MPRRPVNYGELFALLDETYLTLIRIIPTPRLLKSVRKQLVLLTDRQALLIRRDNGRGRYRRPSRAARVQAPDNTRIS